MFLPYLEAARDRITPLERVLRQLMAALSGPLAVTAYSTRDRSTPWSRSRPAAGRGC